MHVNPDISGERLLRLTEVEYLTGLKKSALYAMCKAGKFPAGVKLSARAVAWPLSSVESWIAERIRVARGARQ